MQDLYFARILEELEETLEFIENSLLLIIMSYSTDTSWESFKISVSYASENVLDLLFCVSTGMHGLL